MVLLGRLNAAIVVFLITALAGVWAAYDRQAAWTKLGLIAGAALVFYTLALQSRFRAWRIAQFLTLSAFALSLYFLLGKIFQAWVGPAGISAPLARSLLSLDTDAVAGVLVILISFSFALWLRSLRGKNDQIGSYVTGVVTLTILLALVVTTERVPLFFLMFTGIVWVWWVICGQVARLTRLPRLVVFWIGSVVALAAGLLVASIYPGSLLALAFRLNGPDESFSRLDLWASTLHLIADFPFTGGGLNAFPGLFSRYILVIPVTFLDSSHNLFLEAAIEQGILGSLALAALLFGSIVHVASSFMRESRSLRSTRYPDQADGLLFKGALLTGLVVLVLHGLVEDTLYESWDTLFLFLLPGLAAASVYQPQRSSARLASGRALQVLSDPSVRLRLFLASAAFVVLLIISVRSGRSILSAWNANLGAVEQARLELAGFPQGRWYAGPDPASLLQAKHLFEQALRLNPHNRTAHHRLGLIAMWQMGFQAAVTHLETAHRNEGSFAHHGIRKALGLSYAWTGKFDRAAALLSNVILARSDLSFYGVWWDSQGRPDLADNARRVLAMLSGQ